MWLRGLFDTLKIRSSRNAVRPTARQSRAFRAHLERLEDRTTPATFAVSTLADAGAGSLRDAITQANDEAAHPGADTIVFTGAATGGTISLSTFTNLATGTPVVPQPAGPSALIVTSTISIAGSGETITRSGSAAFRLFQITAAGNLTLGYLTLSNGLAKGGDGAAGMGGGGAAGMGGAIFNQGSLTISGCLLTGNQAIGGAGSSGYGGGGGGLGGPGVGSNGGPPNLAGGAFGGVFGAGGGGGAAGANGFDGGFGGGGGGGGFPGGRGGNSVYGGGGGSGDGGGGADAFNIGGRGSMGSGGGGAGMGGAVFNQRGSVTVVNSAIAGNTAQGGLSSGTGQGGGARGGAVFNLDGSLTVTDSTLAGNTVAPGFGGSPSAAGGAVYSASAEVGPDIPTQTAIVTVANSILANSIGGSDVENFRDAASPGTATINATAPNIVSTAVSNEGGTLSGPQFIVTDPNLGQLTNNGGFTRTLVPSLGSLAIDHGDNAAVATLTTDQRGGNYVRVFGGTVDIGAVEVQRPPKFDAGRILVASGTPSGSAVVFNPGAAGQYDTTSAATLAPYGSVPTALRTATRDVNGDGIPDTILVTGPGTPIRVAVISGADNSTVLVPPFDPFGDDFLGGGFVAVADIDGDGRAEFVVTPDKGGGPRVSIFSLKQDGTISLLSNFFGIDDANFRGGARAALGDVNHDGTPDLAVAAGFLGGPRTALFNGTTLLTTPTRLVNDFFAFPGTDAVSLRNGVFVAISDVNGDNFADLIFGGGPGGAPRVFILSGAIVSGGDVTGAQASPVANFFVAGNVSDRGGVRVAEVDADGDGRADLATGSGEGSPSQVRVYLGKNFTGNGEPSTFQDLDPFASAVLAEGVFVG